VLLLLCRPAELLRDSTRLNISSKNSMRKRFFDKDAFRALYNHRDGYQSASTTTHLWRRRGERRYSSYSITTSALDGVSGQRYSPAVLHPCGKDLRYPLDKRLGGPQNQSGHRG
jgi:hypothetical protein